MKQLLILTVLLFGLTPNAFSQEKTNRETKGDKLFFIYAFDRAIGYYERVDELTAMGQRRLSESHVNLGHNDEAEASYALLIAKTEGVLAEDYFDYAMLLKTDGKYDESNRMMDQFVAKKPEDLRAKSYTENKEKFSDYQTVDADYTVTDLTMNTESQDFGTAYYADKIVYTSTDVRPKMIKRKYNWNGEPYLKLYVAEVENGQLEKRESFDNEFSSKMHDGPASFSNNGTFMAMTTNNASDKSPDKVVELQIFTSNFSGEKWSEPIPFTHNNVAYSVGHPYLLADGNTMYFVSDMPGGYGGTDLYKCTKVGNGAWSTPENLGDQINTESDELFPFVDEANQVLWFASKGHFGLGGIDIFSCAMNGEMWSIVENPGAPLNTRYDDYAFILDEKTHKGYISSNRADGNGLDDIYAFQSTPKEQQKQLTGVAKDINGNYVAGTFVTLLDENGDVLATQTADDNGVYSLNVAPNKTYELIGNKSLYKEGTTSTNSFGPDRKIEADIVMLQDKNNPDTDVALLDTVVTVKEDLAKTVKLKPIFFDYDKWNIRPDAASELNKIVIVMNKYPDMVVELSSYTDCRGENYYNSDLSQKRADATIEYIQARISKPARITGKGLGEAKPTNGCACEDGAVSSCSDSEHQQNRRSEFIVKK